MQYGHSFFKVLQLVLAIVGLTFSLSSESVYAILVVLYAVALIYGLVSVICMLTSKEIFSPSVQSIIEIVVGLIIVAYSIYVVATCQVKDVWIIMAIVVGFILPAVMFITAYEKM